MQLQPDRSERWLLAPLIGGPVALVAAVALAVAADFPPTAAGLLIAAVVVASGVAVPLVMWGARRRRRGQLGRLAASLGYTFEPAGPDLASAPFASAALLARGDADRRVAGNALRGRVGGLDLLLFDYRYGEYDGETGYNVGLTVAALLDGPGRPVQARPEVLAALRERGWSAEGGEGWLLVGTKRLAPQSLAAFAAEVVAVHERTDG